MSKFYVGICKHGTIQAGTVLGIYEDADMPITKVRELYDFGEFCMECLNSGMTVKCIEDDTVAVKRCQQCRDEKIECEMVGSLAKMCVVCKEKKPLFKITNNVCDDCFELEHEDRPELMLNL